MDGRYRLLDQAVSNKPDKVMEFFQIAANHV